MTAMLGEPLITSSGKLSLEGTVKDGNQPPMIPQTEQGESRGGKQACGVTQQGRADRGQMPHPGLPALAAGH